MIEQVIAIAKQAGAAIIKIYQAPVEITYKNDLSPVTLADQVAHKVITDALTKLTPTIPIISEEGAIAPYEERKQWQRFWLVDPLDGTKEFIAKNGEFTVNIALIEHNMPVLGVVYAPANDVLYYASEQGAYKVTNGQAKPLAHVTASNHTAVISRSHASKETLAYLQQQGITVIQRLGSSLKMCAVAEGSAYCYPRLGDCMEWDTAAAHAIVRYSGHQVMDYTTGEELRYNKPSLKNPYHIVK
ncbi:MAG TPA: 3'(2'),5'-bisphosphate nucleotidase CysQ [Metalysinibacillus jejuensis]|uniref:3'(2'),5'-bisphosphate nucleotidase CysQ n=1 Tax=Metalysinibacillus jejuensis TaxID=914327 RepID=A0A921T4C7_9BACL|nr:3'(2'),5'-bisphosphate nucleotidase CysQ [Metalysinibacillus jejuensis]